MKLIHTPRVNARYWTAIALASVFGTNLGDFYAHESGLGIVKGLSVLALIAAHSLSLLSALTSIVTNCITGPSSSSSEPAPPTSQTIWHTARASPATSAYGEFGWTHRSLRVGELSHCMRSSITSFTLNGTNASYWLAMLSARRIRHRPGRHLRRQVWRGNFGDRAHLHPGRCSRRAGFRRATQFIAVYWTVVAVARTAGTV